MFEWITKMMMLLASIFCLVNEAAGFGNIDYSDLSWRQSAIEKGRSMVHYGVNKEGSVVYIVVCPVSPKEGFWMKPDSAKGENHMKVSIHFRGLILQGPSTCQAFVVCEGDSVRRHSLRGFSEEELLKLLGGSPAMSQLENTLIKKTTGGKSPKAEDEPGS